MPEGVSIRSVVVTTAAALLEPNVALATAGTARRATATADTTRRTAAARRRWSIQVMAGSRGGDGGSGHHSAARPSGRPPAKLKKTPRRGVLCRDGEQGGRPR